MRLFIAVKIVLFVLISRVDCCAKNAAKGKSKSSRSLFWPNGDDKAEKQNDGVPWVCNYASNVFKITGMDALTSLVPFGGQEKMNWVCSEFFKFLTTPANAETARSLSRLMDEAQTRDGFWNLIFPFMGSNETSSTTASTSSVSPMSTEQNESNDSNVESSSLQPDYATAADSPSNSDVNDSPTANSGTNEENGASSVKPETGVENGSTGQKEQTDDSVSSPLNPGDFQVNTSNSEKVQKGNDTSSIKKEGKGQSSAKPGANEGISSLANPANGRGKEPSPPKSKSVKTKSRRKKLKKWVTYKKVKKEKDSSASVKTVKVQNSRVLSDTKLKANDSPSLAQQASITKETSRGDPPVRKMQIPLKNSKNRQLHSRRSLEVSGRDSFPALEM